MPYYTFELDEERQNLCTIITPFGKYKYTHLPMGLKFSPEIAHSVMENVLLGIDVADVYINDVGAFSSSWQEHLALLDTILCCIYDNGFTVNLLICEWDVQEMDWLGYWLMPHGLKHWKKKINAILNMDRPRTTTDLCRLIGCVNFYRNMCPSCLHVLASLTACSGLKKTQFSTGHPKCNKYLIKCIY
jgi:hypothetical protein